MSCTRHVTYFEFKEIKIDTYDLKKINEVIDTVISVIEQKLEKLNIKFIKIKKRVLLRYLGAFFNN